MTVVRGLALSVRRRPARPSSGKGWTASRCSSGTPDSSTITGIWRRPTSSWLAEQGFEELWVSEPTLGYGVGAYRAGRDPQPVVAGTTLFTFVGRHNLDARPRS